MSFYENRSVDGGWFLDNIYRVVGSGSSSLFGKDPWVDGTPLCVRYIRLYYDLSQFKLITTTTEMHSLGWVNWEAWR